MAAGTYDIVIEQGTSYSLSIQYADSGNVPIDLAAFNCARMGWNTTRPGNLNLSYNFTTANTNSGLYSFEFGSPTSSGIINFKIPASVTASYFFETADYDLELESIADFYPGGGPQVIRLLQGTVRVLPEVTRITCSGV